MNREIKFRGKRVDNGKWIIGSLYSEYYNTYGSDLLISSVSKDKDEGGNDQYEYSSAEVKPETVGQYTGLKDKNGVEIYEGDILEYERRIENYSEDEECNPRNYNRPRFSYPKVKHTVEFLVSSWVTIKEESVIVIGNIQENPELLK